MLQGQPLLAPDRIGTDAAGPYSPAMDLGNMRQNRVRSVLAQCEACQHKTVLNCDALPADLSVPDVALRLRCSACGSKRISTRPDWRERG